MTDHVVVDFGLIFEVEALVDVGSAT